MDIGEILTRVLAIKSCSFQIHRSDVSYSTSDPRFTCSIGLAKAGAEVRVSEYQAADETPEALVTRCWMRFEKMIEATELRIYLAPPIETKAIAGEAEPDF